MLRGSQPVVSRADVLRWRKACDGLARWFDRIMFDESRRVRYHFVLVDYLCRPVSGDLRASSDVDAAEWVDPADLVRYSLTAYGQSVLPIADVVRRWGRGHIDRFAIER